MRRGGLLINMDSVQNSGKRRSVSQKWWNDRRFLEFLFRKEYLLNKISYAVFKYTHHTSTPVGLSDGLYSKFLYKYPATFVEKLNP
jgi:hypothetical protein